MTQLHPDDLPPADLEDEEQRRFEQGCVRIAMIYLLSYLAVAIASTVFSILTGTHWWIVGWTWPFWLTIILLGVGAVGKDYR